MNSPPRPPQFTQALHFRDLLLGALSASYNDAELASLFQQRKHFLLNYLQQPSLFAAPASASAEDYIIKVDQLHSADSPLGDDILPEHLYAFGETFEPTPTAAEAIDATLRNAPPTLVIFPGIFSEFIQTRAFEEAFSRQHSTFRDEWSSAVHQFRNTHSPEEIAETLSDEQFSLNDVKFAAGSGNRSRDLTELLDVSSLDDKDGRVLVRLVLLKTGFISFESCNDVVKISPIFIRRLSKFFTVLGIPDSITLVGYSMGASVALDVLAKTRVQGPAWSGAVQAMVSVCGVLYGSHLADIALDPSQAQKDNPAHTQVRLMEQLAASLVEPRGQPFWKKPWTVTRNSYAWLRFARGAGRATKAALRSKQSVQLDRIRKLKRKAGPVPALTLVSRVLFDEFNLASPFEYSLNIRKMKLLVAAALGGVRSLTTRSQLQWWRDTTLPTGNLRYYALTATMSQSNLVTPAGPLKENSTTYNAFSPDYEFLCGSYQDFIAASGIVQNDSQVAVSRSQFWPAIAPLLNPAYLEAPPDSRFLGILGTHHWGSVLPFAYENSQDRSVNPFPRLALLKAIAAQVAIDS